MKKFLCLLISISLIQSTALSAIQFDGTDDSANCGSNAVIDNLHQSAHTVCFWFYAPNVSGYWLGKFASSSTFRGWVVFPAGTNTINPWMFWNGSNATTRATATNAFTTNTWTSFCYKHDGSLTGSNIKMFINGAEASYGAATSSSAKNSDAADNLTLGNDSDGGNASNVQLNEIAIWAVQLSDDEIKQYQSARGKRLALQIQPSNLKFFQPLDNQPDGTSADGDVFLDLSGNGNSCTGSDGANNTGLTNKAEQSLTYP